MSVFRRSNSGQAASSVIGMVVDNRSIAHSKVHCRCSSKEGGSW